jgi:DALR anticodon binding domain
LRFSSAEIYALTLASLPSGLRKPSSFSVDGAAKVREKGFALLDQAAVIHYASPTQWLTDQLAVAVYELGYAPAQEWIQLPALVLDPSCLGTFATPLPLKLASLRSFALKSADSSFTDSSSTDLRNEKLKGASGRSQSCTVTSAEIIGHAFIEQLNRCPQQSWIPPRYWMHPKGCLYAEFSTESLTQWLQSLLTIRPYLQLERSNSKPPSTIANGISPDPALFELQYAHARCCSLLELGQKAQLIQLTNNNLSLSSPNPVPWQTSQGILQFQTESERQLLLELMQFPQSLCLSGAIYGHLQSSEPGCQTPVSWPLNNQVLQKHQVWSQLFQSFYRECSVLGDVCTKKPELAQSRFASLILLKNLLEFWLLGLLRIEAPTEL